MDTGPDATRTIRETGFSAQWDTIAAPPSTSAKSEPVHARERELRGSAYIRDGARAHADHPSTQSDLIY